MDWHTLNSCPCPHPACPLIITNVYLPMKCGISSCNFDMCCQIERIHPQWGPESLIWRWGDSGGINNCQGGLNFFPMKFPKFSLFLINQWGNESAAIVRLTNFTNPRFSTVELKIHAKREIHCLLACMSFSEGVNWEGFLYQIGGKVFVSSLATLLMTAVIVRRGGLNASAQSVQKRALPVKRGIKSTLAD